jgi:hypothetical protein
MALFQRCYGDSYGNRLFYDAGALEAAIGEGTLRSVVAVSPDGSVLGHTAISIKHAGAVVCETGNTVVDPSARGRGLLRLLGSGLKERVIRDGFAGYVHYPTTAHGIMQRASVADGGREVGVMLAYIAETTDYKDVRAPTGRLAATVAYQAFRDLPHRLVHVPERYRTLVEDLYADTRLSRTIAAAVAEPAADRSLISQAWNPFRGLLQIFVERPGRDLAAAVASAMQQSKPAVTHVDLPLDEPAIDAAVEALAPLGFVFCALLPEFARTDVLRIQALRDRSGSAFHPDVVNERAAWLCEHMRREAGIPA